MPSSHRAASQLPLWYALLAGPIAWSVQLLVNYYVVALACHGQLNTGALFVHEGVTLTTGLAALAGLLIARRRRAALLAVSSEGAPPQGRSAFMAQSGMVVSAVFLFIIVVGAVPTLTLPPCA